MVMLRRHNLSCNGIKKRRLLLVVFVHFYFRNFVKAEAQLRFYDVISAERGFLAVLSKFKPMNLEAETEG